MRQLGLNRGSARPAVPARAVALLGLVRARRGACKHGLGGETGFAKGC
jgi:hypothetical protein